jgi:hypothetical protein
MTYSTGSTILDDDYNIFATGNAAGTGDNNVANINTVWGTGTADKGYGQGSTLSPVSAGNTITATQWATLISRMTAIANHQGTSITAITEPVIGDTIAAYAALSSNITSIFNNRRNATASGSDLTTNGTTQTTSSWGVSAATTKTITFSSANAARYFFNAGGQIRISFSRSGGGVNQKNIAWTNLLTAVGTLVWTGSSSSTTIAGTTYTGLTKIGGSGTPAVLSAVGVLDMSSTSTQRFKQLDSTYLYTSNYIEIYTAWSGTVLTISTTLYDIDDDDPQVVDGTLTMSTVIRQPSTTYITNSWGTPTQNAASWTLTS